MTHDEWVRQVLAVRNCAHAGRPRFGTPEWHALEVGPPKLAALVLAAECWRDYCDPMTVACDMREQLRYDDAMLYARLKGVSLDVWAGADWRSKAAIPTFEQLQRRRGVA